MKAAPVPASAEAVPDFRKAFRDLEVPIHLASQRSKVATFLTEYLCELEPDEWGGVHLNGSAKVAITHMVREVDSALNVVEVTWTSASDAAWDVQIAAEEAARPLDDLIIEHQARTAEFHATIDAIDVLLADRGPTYEADLARHEEANEAEKSALRQVLSYRPQSMEEHERRLDYLLRTVWRECHLQRWEAAAFFASMMPVGWKAT